MKPINQVVRKNSVAPGFELNANGAFSQLSRVEWHLNLLSIEIRL